MAVIRSEAPRLLRAFLGSGRLGLLALLLELAVPPLSLFGMLFGLAVAVIVAASWALGFVAPAAIVLGAAALAAVGLAAAWARFGRETLPAQALLRIPGYMLAKLPIYLRFLTGRQREWVRTQRDASPKR